MYLAMRLKISKIKNDIKEEPNPLIKSTKSINSLWLILKNINPKKPEINPKFISPWGIQRQSISIKEIQIKSDKKIFKSYKEAFSNGKINLMVEYSEKY